MRVLDAPKVETAVRIYYTYKEIGNKELKELLGLSRSAISEEKSKIKKEMKKRGIIVCRPQNVNVDVAYEMWGWDIADLEKRYKKLKALDLL